MKRVFVKTANVKNFISSMARLLNRQEDIPGMALVYGRPGLGRTRTALWWAAQREDVKFIRTVSLISGRWLLAKIVAELGEEPQRRVSDLFEQCTSILMDKPKVLIFDEVDYLTHDSRVIETLRDIHDITGTIIVFIGMEHADRKLMRQKHLFDRFAEIVKFEELGVEDVRSIADEMCEAKLTDDAIKFLSREANRFRPLIIKLYKAEAIAKANSLKEVTAAHLQGVKK